jgi:flagellar basal body rod protein FlgB
LKNPIIINHLKQTEIYNFADNYRSPLSRERGIRGVGNTCSMEKEMMEMSKHVIREKFEVILIIYLTLDC